MDNSSEEQFWEYLVQLIDKASIVIDRPRGSAHPRCPDTNYPLDYGFLESTNANDGSGIDVWIGSKPDRELEGIVCSVDLAKRDVEVKLLIGCSPREMKQIQLFMNSGSMRTVILMKDL